MEVALAILFNLAGYVIGCRMWYLMGYSKGRLAEMDKHIKTLEIIRDLDSPDPAVRADAEQRAKFYELVND